MTASDAAKDVAALRPRPRVDPDSMPFWEGAQVGELRVPRCESCGLWQFPPRERCAACGGPIELVAHDGRGTVYSYVVMHHDTIPGFDDQLPFVIALVEFEQGCRIPARVVGEWERASLIGSAAQASFEEYDPDALPALVVRLLAS